MVLKKNNMEISGTTKIVIGTRGSELALWQTPHVSSLLQSRFDGLEIEIKKVKTTGDKILDAPLSKIGDKGLFTKELDIALMEGEADIAVHSMKDIPTQIPEALTIAAVLEREDVRDIFIPNPGNPGLKLSEIPKRSEVATGSLRRRCQLLSLRPDLKIREVRGNLNTRISKLNDSSWSGMILAYAGITRLGMKNIIGEIIPLSVMLPAVGQGAIGIIARKNDPSVTAFLKELDHNITRIAVEAERAVLRRLEGGCQIPIGAHAEIDGNSITINALVGNLNGTQIIRDSISGKTVNHQELGTRLAEKLIGRGAGKILGEIRKQAEK